MVVQFSPKILGLNTGIFELFSSSPRLIFGRCVSFYVLLLKILITFWLCENHVNICLFDVLTWIT